MPKVVVLNAFDANRYAHKSHPEASVIISIGTPHDERTRRPQISGNIQDVLCLSFYDVEDPTPALPGMSPEDGQKVAQFVQKWWDRVQLFVIHCDAGQSRSAGVAAAILKVKTGSDVQIFGDSWYRPNMLCYRTTLRALLGRG